MSDPALTLLGDGPLNQIHRALAARLKTYFPETKFSHAAVPARMTKPIWDDLVRRTPFVGLSWIGFPQKGSGRTYVGTAKYAVYLMTTNPRSENLLLGDTNAPGLYGMSQLAAAVLHGFAIPPYGTALVTEVGNLFSEDWGSKDQSLAGVMVEVDGVRLTDAPAAAALDEFFRLQDGWSVSGAESTETLTIRNK